MHYFNLVNNCNCVFRSASLKHFTAICVCVYVCVYMINVHTWVLVYMVNPKLLLMKHLPVAKHTLHPSFWWVEPVYVEESDSIYKITSGFQYDSWQ